LGTKYLISAQQKVKVKKVNEAKRRQNASISAHKGKTENYHTLTTLEIPKPKNSKP
jgi:hypothetical protein